MALISRLRGGWEPGQHAVAAPHRPGGSRRSPAGPTSPLPHLHLSPQPQNPKKGDHQVASLTQEGRAKATCPGLALPTQVLPLEE